MHVSKSESLQLMPDLIYNSIFSVLISSYTQIFVVWIVIFTVVLA